MFIYKVSQIDAGCVQLNHEKSELIWFGGRRNLERLQAMDTTICLGDVDIVPADCVCNLGIMLDSLLSLHQHIAKVTSTCFFHWRLHKLSRPLDIDARKRLVCALITRVDYCNSVLLSLPDSALAPLQRVLDAAARFVQALRPRDHISSALQTLHWLPVRQRITYKLCVLMHGVAFGYAPAYLTGRRGPSLFAARKSTSAVSRQWTVRHPTDVIVGGIQSVLRRGPERLESTSHICASH